MSLADLTVATCLERVAEATATPGGGSVAALSGAAGAGLVEMVCRLTVDKEGYEAVAEDMRAIADEMATEREALLALADVDVEAFDAVMDAIDRADTEDEPGEASAWQRAAEVPLETAERCGRVVDRAETVTRAGNRAAITDAASGAALAHAALRAALYSVEFNLGKLDDATSVAAMTDRADGLAADAEETLVAIEAHLDAGT